MTKMRIQFFTNTIFLFCVFLCYGQRPYVKSTQLPLKAEVFENIPYKTLSEGGTVLLDLYLPKQKSENQKMPLVVQIHGGGWVEGNKDIPAGTYTEKTVLKFLENNFAVISLNYRLVGKENHFPSPIEDVKDALRWISENAENYRFDLDNIGLWGGSAGAHLSLLSAYSNDEDFLGDAKVTTNPVKVRYVLDNFGPTDLNPLFQTNACKIKVALIGLISKQIIEIRRKLIFALTGFYLEENKEKATEILTQISPIKYMQKPVPTYILHGNKDRVVPLSQSKKLKKTLTKNNSEVLMEIVKGGDHGFNQLTEEKEEELAQKMVDFAKNHLN